MAHLPPPLLEWSDLLPRTPTFVDACLRGLPDRWLDVDEGPGTWSVRNVVDHLIEGERTDWLPRVRQLLRHGEAVAFPPFDRLAQGRRGRRSCAELLERSRATRRSARPKYVPNAVGRSTGALSRRPASSSTTRRCSRPNSVRAPRSAMRRWRRRRGEVG